MSGGNYWGVSGATPSRKGHRGPPQEICVNVFLKNKFYAFLSLTFRIH